MTIYPEIDLDLKGNLIFKSDRTLVFKATLTNIETLLDGF